MSARKKVEDWRDLSEDAKAPLWQRSAAAMRLCVGSFAASIFYLALTLFFTIRWIWQPATVVSALYILSTAIL